MAAGAIETRPEIIDPLVVEASAVAHGLRATGAAELAPRQPKGQSPLQTQNVCSRMAALTMASSAELWLPALLPSNGPDHTCPKRTPRP